MNRCFLPLIRIARLTLGVALVMPALPASAGRLFVPNDEDYARIEAAVPTKAIMQPAKPRRLLIFTRNVGYGGHPSMAYANEAFTLMGQKTGAFETVVSDEPGVFHRTNLCRFDAVFFNNTVGNCFSNADLRQDLVEFITGGGGLMGVHGTSVAFTHWPGAVEDWPEFGFAIGARGASHKESDEHVWIRLDDPEHPLNRLFGGQGFDYRDEFFRVDEPYSRDRVRVLLSIDTVKTDVNRGQPRGDCIRADNDYALAWIRNYGRGRVFYCTIAHNPYVFYDARMLQFYLGALQFVLGDLSAPTIPSAKLTPAVRAQEKLGWRLGFEFVPQAWKPVTQQARRPALRELALTESIQDANRLGLLYIGASGFQKVTDAKYFDPQLTDTELAEVRLQLEKACLRLLTYEPREFPADESGCRKLFDFGRKMGIEAFVGAPEPPTLDFLEKLCREYDIKLALTGLGRGSQHAPKQLLKICEGRSHHVGVSADLGAWQQRHQDPVKGARTLRERLITVRVPDEFRGGPAPIEKFLVELGRQQVAPVRFSIQPSVAATEKTRTSRFMEVFNAKTLKIASSQSALRKEAK